VYGANTWQLDWLTLDPTPDKRDADGVQWFATKVEGFWGAPKSDVAFTPKVARAGVFRVPGWKRERIITVTARAYAPTDALLRRAEALVSGLLSGDDVEYPLICQSDIGPLVCSVVLDGDITTTPLTTVSEPGFEFAVQVAAPDPRKYTVAWQVMQTRLPWPAAVSGLDFVSPGGIDFETTGGIHFGLAASSGLMSMANQGTAPAFPTFVLTGPLVTPTITTLGGTLTYNATLGVGESITIDTSVPSVLAGTSSSRRHLVHPANFEAFLIPAATPDGEPGVRTVGLSHLGAETAAGYVTAEFRSAWF
jgi:hypothetical protein